MGCFQIGLVALAVILLILFFYAVKAAIYAVLGGLICAGIGALFGGRDGVKVGFVVGFGIGVLWALFF